MFVCVQIVLHWDQSSGKTIKTFQFSYTLPSDPHQREREEPTGHGIGGAAGMNVSANMDQDLRL